MNSNIEINNGISATAQAVKDLVAKQMRAGAKLADSCAQGTKGENRQETLAEREGARFLFDFSSIRPSGASISGGIKAPGSDSLRNPVRAKGSVCL